MYSCGSSSDIRKKDLQTIIDGGKEAGDFICDQASPSSNQNQRMNGILQNQNPANSDDFVFMNFVLYLFTILFLALTILFSALGGGLALYNTYRTPVSPILSIFGLYLWNGISGK